MRFRQVRVSPERPARASVPVMEVVASRAVTVDVTGAEPVDVAGLFDAEAASLTRLARFYVDDKTAAEDLVQEAFIRAWQALPAFRFESAFSTWMHRLAVNTALMEIRGRSNSEDRETDDSLI